MALTEHQKRLIEQEKRRQAFIKKCQTIPEITDEMKAIEVNLDTLYVDQHPECPRFASEVFLTSKVKLGNFSRAAYNKVLELAPLVAQTLHLYTYEDGEWPGIPGCRGAHLRRTMELANKIAELAGWNVRFKPVRVLWRKAWEKSFLHKKD